MASPSQDSEFTSPIHPPDHRKNRLTFQALTLRILCFISPVLLGSLPASAASLFQDDEQELELLLAEERHEADLLRRQGEFAEARKRLNEHLSDDEEDAASRRLLGRVYLDQGVLDRAERHLVGAIESNGSPAVKQAAARDLVRLMRRLGRGAEAQTEYLGILLDGEAAEDPRNLFLAGELLIEVGDREQAQQLYRKATRRASQDDWEALLARALCMQRLGQIEEAGSTLFAADDRAHENTGRGEADVLVALGNLFFEADREVAEGAGRSAAKMYDEALRLNPTHEGALLGLFELHLVNWHRYQRTAGDFLSKMLELRPNSVEAHLAACSNALRVGKLPLVRQELAVLLAIAPERSEVMTLAAGLAWVEHDREMCNDILSTLTTIDPKNSVPERSVGKYLIELYRFAEARPFLERAVERDTDDYMAWTLLGRARANTGDEEGALEALRHSRKVGGLRQDAWRKNMRLVLERLEREYLSEDFGDLSFSWMPDASAVLSIYLEPFYREAREELSERYGYTPGPTHIEVFRRHKDFSVRSTGFEGFPALGVCFGPVVTALSPLSEMRGTFSWARTSFHEFTHVIHLGLSHNRCPRWITEGLATWEEANRNPAWGRNLRRDLVDASANGRIIPIRDLNAAFRGPRIIFGYYEGGLICELLIGRYGFPPVIRLLEAFDKGLDLDQALKTVYDLTPEELDFQLQKLVDVKLKDLYIEPRWSSNLLLRERLRLASKVPGDPAQRAEWQAAWCTQAWGSWQQGRQIDAEEALRQMRRAGEDSPRAKILLGNMAIQAGQPQRAIESWEEAFAAGAEDFHARIALGNLRLGLGETEEAEKQFLAAERAFPGFADADFAAELRLVSLYIDSDRRDDAMLAAERYVIFDAGSYQWRRRVAAWHAENERWERAAFLLHEANEIDPFSRKLHMEWATALEHLGQFEEALREYEVVAIVPVELDLDSGVPLSEPEVAALFGKRLNCLVELGRLDEAETLIEECADGGITSPEIDEASERLLEARG